MWHHNYVTDCNEYLISTFSESTFPCDYSLQFLFKFTYHSSRYERKCEWVFFFWTQCIILVSFLYNWLIIIHYVGIFVCTDDGWHIFSLISCGCIYRCISTDILPAICRYAGAGCPSACTTDCRSASAWPSRPTVGRIGHVLADRLSVG